MLARCYTGTVNSPGRLRYERESRVGKPVSFGSPGMPNRTKVAGVFLREGFNASAYELSTDVIYTSTGACGEILRYSVMPVYFMQHNEGSFVFLFLANSSLEEACIL